jgi:hypothetical protein
VVTYYLAALDGNNIIATAPTFYPAAGADSMLSLVTQWSPVPPFAQQFQVTNPVTPNSGNLFNVAVQFRITP